MNLGLLVSADCESGHQLLWMKSKVRTWNKKLQMENQQKKDFATFKESKTRKKGEEYLYENIANSSSQIIFPDSHDRS